MNPRKNRPVLFELASRTSRTRSWPVGVSLSGPSSKSAAAPETGPGPRVETPVGAGRRWIRITGGRVLLDLGWPHLAAAGVLLIVLLIATFQAGARSARPPATRADEFQAVLNTRTQAPAEEPEPETPRSTPRPGGGMAAATPTVREEAPPPSELPPSQSERQQTPAFEFQPGCAYVVVQHLSKRAVGAQAAEKIREFLAAKGIPVVIRSGAGDLEVIATEPFRVRQTDAAAAKRERERALKLIEQIRKLGQEFNPTGGYSFDKCYLREPQ